MAVYRNPASVMRLCRQKGLETPGELYECAVGNAPASASPLWYKVARRLASEPALDGARRKRRKAARGRQFAGVRTFKRVKRRRRR